jgi:CDP-glucose 4,6-dehydratase
MLPPDPPARPEPRFWTGRRVLVTGHTGFKGAWLSLWLTQLGAQVVGFSDGVPTTPSLYESARVGELVESVTGDVRDADAVRAVVARTAPEVVLHLAAQPLVRRSFAAPVGTLAVNVMGTAHVLEAVRATASVRSVVVVTSDKCYENREWPWAYREDEALGGHDPYSASKAAAELVTASYRASFFAAPDAAAIASARAGNVIGGGDWAQDRLVPDLARAAAAGVPLALRNPGAVRPWQHVLDPLAGYLVLAQRAFADRACARAFNFGPAGDDARPVGWVVERLAARFGDAVRVEADAGPHPHEAHHLRVDSSLARSALGWRPGWDLETALDRTADWYRAHAAGADARALSLEQLESYSAASSSA